MSDDIHVEPINDTQDHLTSPDCPCRPIFKAGIWVHRSFDGRELDETAHRIEMDVMSAEYVVLFAHWLHGITRSKAIELLAITPQAFECRLAQFLEQLPDEYRRVEEALRPSGM